MKRSVLGRAVGMLFSLTLLFSMGLSAYADVVWEPENDFYWEHSSECAYEGRTYLTNGPEGYAAVMKTPTSAIQTDYILNGVELYVSFTYTDSVGGLWGVVEYAKDENSEVTTAWAWDGGSGWVSMEEMSLVYDNISFCEDHQEEFETYGGEMDGYEIQDTMYIWTYPGSGEEAGAFVSMGEDFQISESISDTYTDENGQIWGRVGYFYGARGWVCMTDPENAALPLAEVPQEELTPPAQPENAPLGNSGIHLAAALVAALVVVTAVLLRVFWRRKKPTEQK